MKFKKGFCRMETVDFLCFGEIIDIESNYIVFRKFNPMAQNEKIEITDIISYEQVKEEDIPPYE